MLDTQAAGTVGDSAYRRIRGDILFGRLKPSERLRLEPLRKRYAVSVTTLREMLNRLASEGLVVAEGQRGFEVAPISDANLEEIADLRILLEGHALKQSFAAATLDWESQVVAAHHKLHRFEARMLAGDTAIREEWKQADWGFHRALISACGSQALMEAHGQVFDKYLRYQMLTLTFRGEVAAGEHRNLLEAALDHDAERAMVILRGHIRGGVEHSIRSRAETAG